MDLNLKEQPMEWRNVKSKWDPAIVKGFKCCEKGHYASASHEKNNEVSETNKHVCMLPVMPQPLQSMIYATYGWTKFERSEVLINNQADVSITDPRLLREM